MVAPKRGEHLTPERAMEEAIRVARLGLGFVAPNPLVGCVIVDKDHRFLSAGAHLRFGENHAEINALKNIGPGQSAEGSTVYVTLEPCSHRGKTGPCAEALVDHKVAKVICGMIDPNPQVSGGGIALLKAAGIEVGQFVSYQKQCERLVEEFLHTMQDATPYVALKLAASLDGKIALSNGQSQWITGADTRGHARNLRGQFDGTLVGAGTFLNDDPLLDFRQTSFEGKKENRIVIFDPKGKAAPFFPKSRLPKNHRLENIFIVSTAEGCAQWEPHGVQTVAWTSSYQGWRGSLKDLRSKGMSSLFVEGGSYAISQFLQYRLFQKLFLYQAPKVLGRGMSWSDSFKIQDIDAALKFKDWSHESVGEDILITARL